jgi:ketosteroid isomerase-like protein
MMNSAANKTTLEIGQHTFDGFVKAIETGETDDFFRRIGEDVRFLVPLPFDEWRGEQRGIARLHELIRFERGEMELRIKFTQTSISASANIAAVEFRVEGTNKGGAYKNHIALFFEITDEKVTAFREYAGDIDPKAVAAVNG